ncbi:MAG: peptidylprolyl isomerase [Candidatus Marinimicrobia bacterium]|nr:peptidylprolyl isomerase [Candidatus Neomarinimicrobiota bacterium]
MKFIKAITLATIISLIFACSLKRESDYVATINGDKISVEDFLNSYRNFLNVTGIQDNLPSRKLLLENVINEKLLLAEFEKNDMGKSDKYLECEKHIYEQLLLNHYYRNELLPAIYFTDKELFDFYIQENTYYHIKQIFATNYEQVKAYYRKLNDGCTFSGLVSTVDEYSEFYEKTDLGYVLLNSIHPRFRNAITTLQIGEISVPLKGKYGYTILKVEDKMKPPILTEYEFAKQKPFLAKKLRNELRDSLLNDYTQKLRDQISFCWNKENLDWLFGVFQQVKSKEDFYPFHEKFVIPGDVICQIDQAPFYYQDMLPLILKSKYKHIKALRDIELLKEFIAGIVIREKMIDIARSLCVQKSQEFQKEYFLKTTKLKMDFWIQSFSDSLQFTDADYNYFYRANEDQFIVPIKRKVYEIRTQDEEMAENLKKRINNVESFQMIALKYSYHRNGTHSDGLLGILSSEDLGKFGSTIFSTPPGKVVGPYTYKGYHYLFLSTDGFDSYSLSLDSVKPLIARRYREELVKRKMASHFAELAKKYHVQHNFRVLKEIKYIDLSKEI